ncbi:hypothetical protein HYPSUDRAFT_207474 [Hypholoma sublateritium FD-334 SS-4]|uniref:Uncharacterized protein n=1 Tax=Hypholoma sublateritium (strain FD-334 SS-4) TaxID=945553 RepID=A0A0D2P628_HYPSF|nr:hypothetical protein HYPSUDRAFT_207474 [Hypholoma sublateritium FD-334 SS-4]
MNALTSRNQRIRIDGNVSAHTIQSISRLHAQVSLATPTGPTTSPFSIETTKAIRVFTKFLLDLPEFLPPHSVPSPVPSPVLSPSGTLDTSKQVADQPSALSLSAPILPPSAPNPSTTNPSTTNKGPSTPVPSTTDAVPSAPIVSKGSKGGRRKPQT